MDCFISLIGQLLKKIIVKEGIYICIKIDITDTIYIYIYIYISVDNQYSFMASVVLREKKDILGEKRHF